MQCLIQSSDECVDVVASPVTDPAEILTVALVSRLIGKIRTRIEIIIQMNAVYVVILDDLSRTVYDKLLHRRNTGIEVVVIVVLDYPTPGAAWPDWNPELRSIRPRRQS